MTIESATQKLIQVLEGFDHPAERITYDGKANTFFTYQMLQALPGEYADDDFANLLFTFCVIINTKEDHVKLLSDVIQRFREEGFTISSIEAESLNSDTGFFYVPIIIKILEDI